MYPLRWPRIAALSFCACLASCGEPSATEQKTSLPGFSVWLPPGVTTHSGKHPASGSHEIRGSGSVLQALPDALTRWLPEGTPSVKVSWRAEVLAAEDVANMPKLFDQIMAGVGKRTGQLLVLPQDRWVAVYAVQDSKVAMGFAHCAPWLTINVVVAAERRVAHPEAIAGKVVASIECHLPSEQAPKFEASLAPPADYGRLLGTNLPTYYSTGGATLLTTMTNGDVARDGALLEKILRNLVTATAGVDDPDLKVSTRSVKRVDGARASLNTLHGKVVEQHVMSFIGTVYCADLDVSIMMLVGGKPDPHISPESLVQAVGCPSTDSTPTQERSVSEAFGLACTAGNAQACVDLANLIDQGSAASDRGSAAQLRASACRLGRRDSCGKS